MAPTCMTQRPLIVNLQQLLPVCIDEVQQQTKNGYTKSRPLSAAVLHSINAMPKEDASDVVTDPGDWEDFSYSMTKRAHDGVTDQSDWGQSDDEGSRCSSRSDFPVKATFIHFDAPLPEDEVESSQTLKRCTSSPVITTTTSSPAVFGQWSAGDIPDLDLDRKVESKKNERYQCDLTDHSDDESYNGRSDDGSGSRCSSENLPVKATFIHFDTSSFVDEEETQALKRSVSAPSILMTRPFEEELELDLYFEEESEQNPFDLEVVQPMMKEAHERGQCKPCAYFLLKKDGCRWGDECEFCHLCPAGELKKRKKEKAKAMKQEEQMLRPKKYPVRYGRRPHWWGRKSTSKAA